MATLFDLPPVDVLFTHVFGCLGLLDVWMLRLACRDLHGLCWDYFTSVCVSLSVLLSPDDVDGGGDDRSSLGLGASIAILEKCRKVQDLRVISLDKNGGFPKHLQRLVLVLSEANIVLKRLCFSGVNLSSAVPLLGGLSSKCRDLQALELCHVTVDDATSIQWVVSQLLLNSTSQSVTNLLMQNLTLSPTQPLPTKSLSGLRRFAVSSVLFPVDTVRFFGR